MIKPIKVTVSQRSFKNAAVTMDNLLREYFAKELKELERRPRAPIISTSTETSSSRTETQPITVAEISSKSDKFIVPVEPPYSISANVKNGMRIPDLTAGMGKRKFAILRRPPVLSKRQKKRQRHGKNGKRRRPPPRPKGAKAHKRPRQTKRKRQMVEFI